MNWLNAVKMVKCKIAEKNPSYSQTGYMTISFKDQSKSVRKDCSGYVSACLYYYGAFPKSFTTTSWGFSNDDKVEKYCRTKIGYKIKEEMLVLFFNGEMELVNEEIVNTGNHFEVRMYKNIIITKATQNGACGIILSHNHPSGNYEPSISDIKLTKSLKEILDQTELKLFDHIIVSNKGSYSFRKNKLVVDDVLRKS